MGARLGFRLDIDGRNEKFLRDLQVDPSQAFPGAYAGYILFLITDVDVDQTKWLQSHMALLDELTARDLAFAVFANRVELDVGDLLKKEARRFGVEGRDLDEWETSASVGATRLVREGAAIKLKGRTLTAMTGGAVAAAEAFGVTASLPCLYVFDGVPSREPYVVELERRLIPKLRQVFQRSIAQFQREGAREVRKLAQDFAEIASAIKEAKAARNFAMTKRDRAHQVVRTAYAQSQDQTRDEYDRERAARRHQQALAELAGLEQVPDEVPAALEAALAQLGHAIRTTRARWFTDCLRVEVEAAQMRGRYERIGAAGMEVIYRVASDVIVGLGKPGP